MSSDQDSLEQKFKRALEVEDHGFTKSVMKSLPPKARARKKYQLPASLLWLLASGALLLCGFLQPAPSMQSFWAIGTCMATFMSAVSVDWADIEAWAEGFF